MLAACPSVRVFDSYRLHQFFIQVSSRADRTQPAEYQSLTLNAVVGSLAVQAHSHLSGFLT